MYMYMYDICMIYQSQKHPSLKDGGPRVVKNGLKHPMLSISPSPRCVGEFVSYNPRPSSSGK